MSKRKLTRVVREERGVTLMIVLGVMVVVVGLVAAALELTTSGASYVTNTTARTKAYEAAVAGINVAVAELDQNPDAWLQCPSSNGLQYVNPLDNNPAKPDIAVDPYREQYEYTMLPATTGGGSTCVPNNETSIIDTSVNAAGQFRMLFTGSAYDSSVAGGGTQATTTRSIVVSFKRSSLLNYIYYTSFEDPAPTSQNGAADCANLYFWGNPKRPSNCAQIEFVTGDSVAGPLWSNDSLDVCGSPDFGRSGTADVVEAHDLYCDSGARPTPVIDGGSGAFTPTGGAVLDIPQNNAQIESDTSTSYTFEGPTDIVLKGASMVVTNAQYSAQPITLPAEPNAVIYVANSGDCSAPFVAIGSPYDDPSYGTGTENPGSDSGCGDAYVQGNYSQSLTIASQNDIVVNGSITDSSATGTALLGLVPNNYVRIFHPIVGMRYDSDSCASDQNGPGSLNDLTIDAAILAVNDSFIVDNYGCGAPLGTLTVLGAIAQKYRGTVAESSGYGGVAHGYYKAYTYNPLLSSLEPPDFLNPTNVEWEIGRETLCYSGAGTADVTGVSGASDAACPAAAG